MAFEVNKTEWSELYVFLKLLADGKLFMGNHKGEKNEKSFWPISTIERVDEDGPRRYFIEGDMVRVEGKGEYIKLNRAALDAMADKVLALMKSSNEEVIECPEDIEKFLDQTKIFKLEPETSDRTDLKIGFWSNATIPSGFVIQSRLAPAHLLLDGGRAANIKLELSGVKLANPEVNNINAIDSTEVVRDRIIEIERLGGVLKYSDVADKVFRCNLQMIDLHFARILSEMLRTFQMEGKSRIYEVMNLVKIQNPVKVKEDLIQKHRFYEYKMKEFLMTVVRGMRPAKIFNGEHSAVDGMLLVNGNGEIVGFHKNNQDVFEDFLYLNTRFVKGSVDKDKYGFLERENGVYYFKLNAKIGLVKR